MWFWLISAIAGSIIGSATDSWFRDTKLGFGFMLKLIRSILGRQKDTASNCSQTKKANGKVPRTCQTTRQYRSSYQNTRRTKK